MSEIAVAGLVKRWGDHRAVDGIDFVVPAGSLVVLLGPSGCGKSTTLRLIAGLEAPDAGRVILAGHDVTALPPGERRIAMVFQSYALFPHLSVAENLIFGLRVRRVAAGERARRLERVAELLGLGGFMERKPAQLSGGQQQRVALGRAIIAEHPVCLMDEPLSNLDAQLRQEMRREIRLLQQRLDMTLVYVTHDQSEAMSMADRVILMRQGRIEQDAPPDLLYAAPATVFAARFIGTPPMNLLALEDGPRGAAIAGSAEPVSAEGGAGLLLGLRPEHIRLAGSGHAAAVIATEYLGADTVITCRIGRESLALRHPGRAPLAPGTAVRLGWNDADALLFDAASGRRIERRLTPTRESARERVR